MSYARFAAFVVPARSYPAFWRLILGVVTIAIVTMIWMVALFGAFTAISNLSVEDAATDLMQPDAPRPGITVLFLMLLGGLGLGAVAAARLWHKRSVGSLFGPRVATLRNFVISAGASFGAMALIGLVTLPFIDPLVPNLDLFRWILWLPVALFALAVQTGSEELVFRGYLQSQMAARFRSPILWLLVPALLFGLVHVQPGNSMSFTVTVITVAFLFGVLAGDLTARTGNIGAAWGFHFANNALIVLLVSNTPALAGLSLYQTAAPLTELASWSPVILLEFATLVAIWALIRRVLAV